MTGNEKFQHGQTPAYIAAMTSHVAAVCVLANRDKRVLYDRGPDGRTPYDILYSKFSTFLLTDSRSSPPGSSLVLFVYR